MNIEERIAKWEGRIERLRDFDAHEWADDLSDMLAELKAHRSYMANLPPEVE